MKGSLNNLCLALNLLPSLALAGLHLACGASPPEMESFRIADSAAIEVVESFEPAWRPGEEWRLAEAPSLEIGVEDGDPHYLFSEIVGAVRLDDGRIVVGDRGGNELRFYDDAGEYLDAVGGSGQGPGEFQYLRALLRCGTDTIIGFDLSWQAKLFDIDGNYVRQMRLTEPGLQRTPYNLTCSQRGHFLVTGWGEQSLGGQSIGFFRATSPVSVLDRDGEPILDLGEFPSSERIGTLGGNRPHPYGKSTVLALGPERIYVGTGDAFEIAIYDFNGTLVRLIRGPPGDLEIRPEHLELLRRERLAETSPERRPAVERELLEMPMPPSFPAYSALRLDSEGNLWVRKYLRPGEREIYWAVFSPQGILLGEVEVPVGMRVMEIGSDYLLGAHSDELGVERVRVYGLEKG